MTESRLRHARAGAEPQQPPDGHGRVRPKRLGSTLWLEREMSAPQVDRLVATAAEIGLETLRVVLVWPWLEPRPGVWEFDLFDVAFAAAERHGISIKATLTTNSGPWHIGTPGVLHSATLTLGAGQRPAMRAYVHAVVSRYRDHPALGQWVVWNEPSNPVHAPGHVPERSDEAREAWATFLARRYGDVETLNARWLNGFESFADAPFPEDNVHPVHREWFWQSFGPWLDEARFRADRLREELDWVVDLVRALDPDTETCANPNALFANHAAAGVDFLGLSSATDVVGASFHPAWHLDFAPASEHAGLIAAATRFLRELPGEHRVEVTEIQSGPTTHSALRSLDATPQRIVGWHLAALLSGAESATGWCLNVRWGDNEAGDFALLDDEDRPAGRAAAVRRLHEVLLDLEDRIGDHEPVPARALALCSFPAQAVDAVSVRIQPPLPGREETDGVRGALLAAALLSELGVPAALSPLESLPADRRLGLLIASHVTAWDHDQAHRVLQATARGATLLLDAASGRKDTDAALHRPWPGRLTERLGFRGRGLRADVDGHVVAMHGLPLGRFPLTRLEPELAAGAGWRAWTELSFAADGASCVWERPFGRGRVILVGGQLGPALVHDRDSRPLVRHLLARAADGLQVEARALTPAVITLSVRGTRGAAVGVLAPTLRERGGRPVRLLLPPGEHRELWTGQPVEAGPDGQTELPAADGVALIVIASSPQDSIAASP